MNAAGDILESPGHHWETADEAAARARRQERVWDIVWRRRITYFATLVPSFYLASYRLRTHPAYRELFRVMKRAVLPAFFALAFVAVALYGASRALIAVARSFGLL